MKLPSEEKPVSVLISSCLTLNIYAIVKHFFVFSISVEGNSTFADILCYFNQCHELSNVCICYDKIFS